jgi:hypothetical protein
MAARITHSHFERYAQHRLEFVRNIAALAEREDYLEVSLRVPLRPDSPLLPCSLPPLSSPFTSPPSPLPSPPFTWAELA